MLLANFYFIKFMNIAIYRKYRPNTFSEVLGQDQVINILKESAKQDRFAHAYLFSGPRGTGKTTTARLVAKTLNCQKRYSDKKFKTKGEPCNECEACLGIDQGKNMDIVEIDAASNRGIDEIRNLKESVRVSPSESKFKVFIIDEAHMLTKAAFNALLKTLEEPPKYVVMILATTEIDKLPITITSRTQQLIFKKISIKEMVQKLNLIAKENKIRIDNESLELIASSAEGSFRDAEAIFDQLMTICGNKIDIDDVEKILGRVGFDTLIKVSEFIADKDLDSLLEVVADIVDTGYDINQFTFDIIHHLRKLIVLSYSPNMITKFKNEISEDHLNRVKKNADKVSETHLKLLKNLINAYSQMRYSRFPVIPLEIAIIETLKTS